MYKAGGNIMAVIILKGDLTMERGLYFEFDELRRHPVTLHFYLGV